MYPFKELKPDDFAVFQRYIDINKFINSEYCFTTLFTWQKAFHIKFAIIENCLCANGGWDNLEYYYLPLGEKNDIRRALATLIEYRTASGKPFRLMSVSDDMINLLGEIDMLDKFEKEEKREFSDYVYKREKLITLSGNKLHGKRNHFNFFTMNNVYAMEDITEQNIGECRDMLINAIDRRSANADDELDVTMKALDNRDALNLTGGALIVNGAVEGVVLAEEFYGMAIMNIAKANVEIRGASVALFKLFLEKYLTGCEYVNFTDDMGVEGLRRAKLSYAPDYMIDKYVLTIKN